MGAGVVRAGWVERETHRTVCGTIAGGLARASLASHYALLHEL
jgi:hypothetical protein